MKKILLAIVVCCSFCCQGIATNSAAKLNAIETIEKKINALKAERENIEHKDSSLYDEQSVVKKKKEMLRDKITNLERNGVCGVLYYKTLLEKKENEVKESTLLAAGYKYLVEINKINLNIDKANIELIKAEIKAGETPKIPLDVAKALVNRTKSQIKVCETIVKTYHAKIKEKDAYSKFFESCIEIDEKADEIRKNTTSSDSYIYTTNIELAEIRAKKAMLRLKLKHAQAERKQVEIKEAQAKAEFSKIDTEFCKTFLKFNKVIDEKNSMSFFNHN